MSTSKNDPMKVTIGNDLVGWACGVCRTPFIAADKHASVGNTEWLTAQRHCSLICWRCGVGLGRPRPDATCLKCINEQLQEEERRLLEKATVVPIEEVRGAVVVPFTDTYFESIEDFFLGRDKLEEPVDFLWLCTPSKFSLEGAADSIIDAELEQHHDSAEVPSKDRALLQGMIDAWARSQDIVSWDRDYSRVVRVVERSDVGTEEVPTTDVPTPS